MNKTKLISTRRRFWDWLVRNIRSDIVLPWPYQWIRALLFPRQMMLCWLSENCGFNWQTGSWTIHGVEYSDSFFSAFEASTPDDKCFRVEVAANSEGKPVVTVYHLLRLSRLSPGGTEELIGDMRCCQCPPPAAAPAVAAEDQPLNNIRKHRLFAGDQP